MLVFTPGYRKVATGVAPLPRRLLRLRRRTGGSVRRITNHFTEPVSQSSRLEETDKDADRSADSLLSRGVL